MLKDNQILKDIIDFFSQVFEKKGERYFYADYKIEWLNKIGLDKNWAREASTARTTKGWNQIKELNYN